MNDLTIVLRSMRVRLFSTCTTVAMVGVGVALILVLLTLQASGRRAFERGTGNMHLLVSADASPLVAVLNSVFYANPPRRPLTWAQYQSLQRIAPFEYAIPVQYGDSYRNLPVLATTRDFFDRFQPNLGEAWTLAQGRFFDKPFEVVVGASAAATTGLKVGDVIHLSHGAPQSRLTGNPSAAAPHVHSEFDYTVVGILKATGGSHDRALITDVTGAWIIHAYDRRERAAGTAHESQVTGKPDAPRDDEAHADGDGDDHAHDEHDHDEAEGEHHHEHAGPPLTEADLTDEDRKITGVYLRLVTREGSNTPANLQTVFDQLRRDPSLTVAQPKQEIETLFRIVGGMNRVFLAIAACVLVSSAISILLALYNSMEQRRQQIAILRVLGASRSRVFGLITAESVLIGLFGSITGMAMALAGAGLASNWLRTQVGVAVGAVVQPRIAVGVLLVTVLLAALAGVIPAIRAYMTPVSKNLKPSA